MQFRTSGRYKRRLEGLFAQRLEKQFAQIDRQPGDTYAERIAHLRDCIGRLPEQNRDAVDLVYVRGMSRVEAAEHIGIEADTLRKRLDRAELWPLACHARYPRQTPAKTWLLQRS